MRRGKTEAGGMPSSLKQKGSTNVVQEDFEKIISFLKTKKGPQKTITIARACGHERTHQINPTIYQMEKLKLVQKSKSDPPFWSLLHTAIDGFADPTSSSRQQYHTGIPYNPQEMTHHTTGFMNDTQCRKRESGNFRGSPTWRNRGNDRYQQKRKHLQIKEKFNNNAGFSKGMRSDSSAKSNLQASVNSLDAVTSNFTLPANQQISRESLFKRTINDKNAPGAYTLLEHSHEKRMISYDYHRRHSPNYPNKLDSELPASGMQMIPNEYTKAQAVTRIKSDDTHNKYLAADNNADPVHENLNNPNSHTSVMTNIPLLFGNNTEMGDNNENTDDEEYDLNFRISDIVSIRDPDIRADLPDLKNCDKFVIQTNADSEIPFKMEQYSDTINMAESDQKFWVEDGYLEPTDHYKTLGPDTDTGVLNNILDSNLLNILRDLPWKTTTKSILASKLQIAEGDLEKLLDTCFKKEWIDYSPFGHVRLTESGLKYVSERKQSRIGMMQLNRGPAPYPNQLLQNNSAFKGENPALWPEMHGSVMEMADTTNTPQVSFCRIQEHPLGQNNNSVCSNLSGQNNSAHDMGPRGKQLMPWLSGGSQVPYTSEQPSSKPSFIRAEVSSLLPTRVTSSSFGQHLRDDETNISAGEYHAFIDVSKSQRMSSFNYSSILSQQEHLQQKRPALLSTPDARGSSNSPRWLPGSAKVALLPCPRQSTYQLHRQQDTPTNLQISTESFAALNKNPISAFMEYGQCRHTPARIEVLNQRGPSHKPVFTIAAVLGTRVFPGITSSNKKDGKKDAAEQAIRILIAEGQYNMPANSSVMSLPESSMTQFDKIAALTHFKFNQLIAVIPESLVGRKVIAGLVMKMNDADTGTVVAIGSGNRCITGDKLSLRGLTVNDCHAEIVTRRGFMRFLYSQLKSYDSNKEHPLFEKSVTGKLKIKDAITFHLYISTAPCGDGALFSPRDVESNNVELTDSCTNHKPTFDTNVQGVLRTKMEGGEGTIPVDPEKPAQTWDGIVRGERLRTMSCSDKICRWNVVGLQGALLANFLDPVYLNSITLGFLFDAGHLSRAVCCRLNRGEPSLDRNLPYPYRLNHPAIGRVTACDATRETQKTKSYSINWMVEDDKPEIVDGCQGTSYTADKNEPSQASRLCKKYMLDYFHQTCQLLEQKDFFNVPTYSMAKRVSIQFLQAKQAMFKKFQETNCGIWLGKPVEEEMFS